MPFRAVHAGLISKRRMGEFNALRHLHVREMPPEKIKLLREQAISVKLYLRSCSIPAYLPYKNGKSATRSQAGRP